MNALRKKNLLHVIVLLAVCLPGWNIVSAQCWNSLSGQCLTVIPDLSTSLRIVLPSISLAPEIKINEKADAYLISVDRAINYYPTAVAARSIRQHVEEFYIKLARDVLSKIQGAPALLEVSLGRLYKLEKKDKGWKLSGPFDWVTKEEQERALSEIRAMAISLNSIERAARQRSAARNSTVHNSTGRNSAGRNSSGTFDSNAFRQALEININGWN